MIAVIVLLALILFALCGGAPVLRALFWIALALVFLVLFVPAPGVNQ